MGQQVKHLMDEADIGSGDQSAGQRDVERDEQTLGGGRNDDVPQSRMLQNGTHLARIVALPLADGTFEAQVYVRLTREPEIAETYIPAGTFASEAEAWTAAEERARRAIDDLVAKSS